jgi:uncharacterized protein YukE
MADGTVSYSKEEMMALKSDLDVQIKKYSDLVTDLNAQINNMGNYWVTEDEEALAIYNKLKEAYAKFISNMQNGSDHMQQFSQRVQAKVDDYAGAESDSNATVTAIGG